MSTHKEAAGGVRTQAALMIVVPFSRLLLILPFGNLLQLKSSPDRDVDRGRRKVIRAIAPALIDSPMLRSEWFSAELKQQLLQMSGRSERIIRKAVEALQRRNTTLAAEVLAEDRAIDASKPAWLSAFNVESKESGFYRTSLASRKAPEKVVMEPVRYGNPPRAMLETFRDAFGAMLTREKSCMLLDVTAHTHVFGRPAGAWVFDEIMAITKRHAAAADAPVWIGTRIEIARHMLAQAAQLVETRAS